MPISPVTKKKSGGISASGWNSKKIITPQTDWCRAKNLTKHSKPGCLGKFDISWLSLHRISFLKWHWFPWEETLPIATISTARHSRLSSRNRSFPVRPQRQLAQERVEHEPESFPRGGAWGCFLSPAANGIRRAAYEWRKVSAATSNSLQREIRGRLVPKDNKGSGGGAGDAMSGCVSRRIREGRWFLGISQLFTGRWNRSQVLGESRPYAKRQSPISLSYWHRSLSWCDWVGQLLCSSPCHQPCCYRQGIGHVGSALGRGEFES